MPAPATTSMPARVLITNAEERSMLATCRSLHAAGYAVSAVAFTSLACTHASRSCSERLRVTDPAVDSERFIDELRDELGRRPYAMLVPGSDRAILAISSARERLAPLTRIGLPDEQAVERSLDRSALAAAAAEVGLPTARSIPCDTRDEVLDAARELGYPVVVKSAASANRVGRSIRQLFPTRHFEQQAALVGARIDQPGALLVQRFERGAVVSFAGVMTGDRLLASAVARYRRTWPVGAGNAAFAETMAAPAQLREAVPELLTRIGWEGVFELELIQTEDGRFVPIDLNPRPYGSLALAGAAGAPLAAIWCDWLLDRATPPSEARPGFRYRWEDGELRHLAWQLRRRNYRDALAVTRPYRSVTHAYFQRDDPLPLLMRSADQARAASRRLTARTRPEH